MVKLRFGIIGLGYFGNTHAEVLADLPGVELVALSTRRPDVLAQAAERFGVSKTYRDYHELLADPTIDAVSVVTHVDSHREVAIAALKAGKHVLLEKPMAPTVADCDAILAEAAQASGKFMVGHVCRFDARVALAKEAVDAGRIGKIVSMHATRNLSRTLTAQPRILNSISPLMGDGIHDTDIMLWLTGARVQTVYAQTVRVRDFKHPDIGWAMYRFDSGAVGVIETVWYLPDKTPCLVDARTEIIGTEGALYIDCGEAGLTITDVQGTSKPDCAYWPLIHGRRAGALRTEIAYFVDCVQKDQEPAVVPPLSSRDAVAVIEAAERSAATAEIQRM